MPIYEKTFRGATFKYTEGQVDPPSSLYTFEDEQVVRDRFWHVLPGEVVFDIGAAFGSYTLPAAALGAKMVYAFVPQGEYGDLVNNINLNGFKNVTPLKIGLYDKEGWLNALTQGFSTGKMDESDSNVFPVTTLDNVVFTQLKLGNIDYIKVDVEGAEVHVIWGAEKTLKKYKPRRVLIENHLFKRPIIADEVKIAVEGLGLGYKEVERVPYAHISHSYFELKED